METDAFKTRDGIALVLAMTFPTAAAAGYFIVLAGHESMRIVYGVSKALQFAFPLFWVCLVQRGKLRPTVPAMRDISQGALLGIGIAGAMLALYAFYFRSSVFLADAPAFIWTKLHDMGTTTPARFLALAVFISLLHSFLEEYYWRWFVFGQLRRRISFRAALVFSSLAFMSHHVLIVGAFLKPEHWPVTLLFSLGVAVGGALWAWLFERTRSLYGPWTSHVFVDAGIMIIGFDLCREYWP